APFSVGCYQSMTVPREDFGRERALCPFSARQRCARGYGPLLRIDQENHFACTRRQTRTVRRKEEITRFTVCYGHVTNGCPTEIVQVNGVALGDRQQLCIGRGGHGRHVCLPLQRNMLERHGLF